MMKPIMGNVIVPFVDDFLRSDSFYPNKVLLPRVSFDCR